MVQVWENILLAYLPHDYCQVGRELTMEYFGEEYSVKIEGVGYKPLYDPDNLLPKT